MVGGCFSVLGSPVMNYYPAHTCPCLRLDYKMSSSSFSSMQSFVRTKKFRRIRSLELRSSFVDSGKDFLGVVNRSLRKQTKVRPSIIVNEIGDQDEDDFEDVKMQLLNYFTYKAVRTVLNQLHEVHPPQYMWFYNYVTRNKPGDGKLFIRNLGKERQDLAERVMATRLHLYGKWIKKFDHDKMYQEISEENLELMRLRLMEIVAWPWDDTNTEKIG